MSQALPEPDCHCVENGNLVLEAVGVLHEHNCQWFAWFATYGKSYSWSVPLE